MSLFRLSTLLSLAGAVAAGALLFWTSQSVQQAENKLGRLQQGIRTEEQAIRVLRAEWDYLNRPDRLETLAAEYLDLSSSGGAAMAPDMKALPEIPPEEPELQPEPAMLSTEPAAGPAVPVPGVKPRIEGNRSFQSLLRDINKAGEPHER